MPSRIFWNQGEVCVAGSWILVERPIYEEFVDRFSQLAKAEAIFGPVVPVIPFDNEANAIRIANDILYGLADGIQTSDIRRALPLADRIKAGTIWTDTWHKYHLNAPFGGYKMSGYGRKQGAEALESYTQYKTIWVNLA